MRAEFLCFIFPCASSAGLQALLSRAELSVLRMY